MAQLTFAEEPIERVTQRKATIIEYAHACIGASGATLEQPRECVLVLPGTLGDGTFTVSGWQEAIERAAAVNPGTRLALSRRRGSLRWNSTGSAPRLRVVDHTDWDGLSPAGGEFLYDEPLDLRGGSTVEVILVGGARPYVVCRALHAVMDALGLVHFLRDVFRSLRGEAPLGTNSDVGDWDLLTDMTCHDKTSLKGTPPHATGGPRGDTVGDTWRAVHVPGPTSKLLPTVMRAVAETSNKYAEQPARIAVPVSLRRYYPDLRTTMNTTSMLQVEVDPDDDLEEIAGAITRKLESNAVANVPGFLPLFKAVPIGRLDKTMARTTKNYTKRKLLETAVVSNLGRYQRAELTGGGFVPDGIYLLPIPGNTYVSLSSLDDDVWITVGTEEIYATDGRFDDLVGRITRAVALARPERAPAQQPRGR
jgi:hypothetical protein